MEQVLQCYGKGIAAGIVLITVMVLLFAGIRDEQGNRGIINIVKTWIPEEETITENAAIDAFAEAGEVAYPTIRYAYNGMLHRGAYLPGDLFSAVDGMGEERSVLWCEMTDPHGNSCTIESRKVRLCLMWRGSIRCGSARQTKQTAEASVSFRYP